MAQGSTNGTSSLPVSVLPAIMPGLVCSSNQLSIQTETAPQFIDITDQVAEIVAKANVELGAVVVYSRHTTAAIKVNECEPLLIEDMCERLALLFPKEDEYRHNNFEIRTVNMYPDEQPNGHAHCQHLLLPTSETIPIVQGQLGMGRWQRLFLVELDQARPREISIFVFGQPRL
ncbi:MAG: secondary thiamine-phosphate synthase enzyme YjbQ [Chloroflexota bacterium]|nr:YjbQ family protein [Chloroflexota bacterium]